MKIFLKTDSASAFELATTEQQGIHSRFVTIGERRFDTLAPLVSAYPQLAAQEELQAYCEICTHLYCRSMSFLLIEDAEEYRSRYDKLLKHGASTANFGPYDITEVAPPRISDGTLVYYVEDSLHSLPYRVNVPWPAQDDHLVHFKLLPLRK